MQIQIQALEEKTNHIVDLSDIGNIFPADDVVYFNNIPCRLSTAIPAIPPCCCLQYQGDNRDCKIHKYLGDPS